MQLILATNNTNKLREVREMLTDTQITVLGQREAGFALDVEETGQTFAENAELKAAALWEMAAKAGQRCYTLADDSGLTVDALDGAPGIYSARWAGEGASERQLCEKLLHEMAHVPDDKRSAAFVCAMCLITPNGERLRFEGRVEGVIAHTMSGENGFGYDPVFLYHGISFSDLPSAEKHCVSHRHNALQQVMTYLQETGKEDSHADQ